MKSVKVTRPCDWYLHKDDPKACGHCNGTGFTQHKEQLVLCVGGPFNMKFKNQSALGRYADNYLQYNSSCRGNRRQTEFPKIVYVWLPMLMEKLKILTR